MGKRQSHGPAGLALLILLLTGCGGNAAGPAAQAAANVSQDASANSQRLSAEGENLLHGYLQAAQLPDLHWPSFANFQKEAIEFYDSCSGTLPWIQLGKPTVQARSMIRAFQAADLRGLRAKDYDGPLWDERLARFEGKTAISEPDLVKFDLALTVSTMRFISDLHIGRVNPREFHFALDIDHDQIDLSQFLLRRVINTADVDAVIASVEPPFPIYRRTEAALKTYMELARRDSGEPLPVPPRPVKPGGTYAGVQRLGELLKLLGDLPEEQSQRDSGEVYQGAVVEGVKHFQSRHGLDPTGILDAPTLKQLNTPLSRRVTQIQLAMERMRWLPHRFDRPPVVVNIPEFRLYAVNEEYRSVFSMEVVVGKAYRHKTPVFASNIKSVIFRPYWNVPRSILRAELIPHLEKDPSYFIENSYEVVDRNERVVSEGAVSEDIEEQLRLGKLQVRQRPGPENALGLLKFEFPNPYSVYMHGTPATQLFSRLRRDFSHGCIRVEDPVKLAEWVLRDMPEWTGDRIREAMNGEETFEVKLDKPIPVLILYSTVVVLEDGVVRFFDDIYGLDASLEQALDSGAPYAISVKASAAQ
jgi:L,D-transpeptidase YcbB